MFKQLHKIKNIFLDLIFPKFCLGCDKEGAYICDACESQLQINYYPFCPTCKNRLALDKKIRCCKPMIKFCLSPFLYDNPLVKKSIHNFKYAFIKDIGSELAEFQMQSIQESFVKKQIAEHPEKFIIVPVPLHRKRLAWRGFNQSDILAQNISKKLSISISLDLRRIKNTLPQIEMQDREKRLENILGAFDCKKPNKISGKIVILIDDIITTSATMEECAKILKENGAKEIWGLTVAR